MPSINESSWFKIEKCRDEKDFFHFTSLTRLSFDNLVSVTQLIINKLFAHREDGLSHQQDLLRRKCGARDAVPITLKYLTRKSEAKYLHIQFRETHTCCIVRVGLGMSTAIRSLFGYDNSRVKLETRVEVLMLVANLTKYLVGIIGHLIGIIDGLKLELLQPSGFLEKNRYCNG